MSPNTTHYTGWKGSLQSICSNAANIVPFVQARKIVCTWTCTLPLWMCATLALSWCGFTGVICSGATAASVPTLQMMNSLVNSTSFMSASNTGNGSIIEVPWWASNLILGCFCPVQTGCFWIFGPGCSLWKRQLWDFRSNWSPALGPDKHS